MQMFHELVDILNVHNSQGWCIAKLSLLHGWQRPELLDDLPLLSKAYQQGNYSQEAGLELNSQDWNWCFQGM